MSAITFNLKSFQLGLRRHSHNFHSISCHQIPTQPVYVACDDISLPFNIVFLIW
jgi:hypothetical protein